MEKGDSYVLPAGLPFMLIHCRNQYRDFSKKWKMELSYVSAISLPGMTARRNQVGIQYRCLQTVFTGVLFTCLRTYNQVKKNYTCTRCSFTKKSKAGHCKMPMEAIPESRIRQVQKDKARFYSCRVQKYKDVKVEGGNYRKIKRRKRFRCRRQKDTEDNVGDYMCI